MAPGDLRHCKRALIREVRAVDQVAIAGAVHSGDVEVNGEVEIPELGRHVLKSGRPVCVDEAVKRPLTQIRAKISYADIENVVGIEDVGIAKSSSQVLVISSLGCVRQILRLA